MKAAVHAAHASLDALSKACREEQASTTEECKQLKRKLQELEKDLKVAMAEKEIWKERYTSVRTRISDVFGIGEIPTNGNSEDETIASAPATPKERMAATQTRSKPSVFKQDFCCPDCSKMFLAGEMTFLYANHRRKFHPAVVTASASAKAYAAAAAASS